MSAHRAGSDTASTYSSSSLGRSSSYARPSAGAGAHLDAAAPPAYAPPAATSPGLAGKRPPPPPPPPGAGAKKKEFVTALYDYEAQAAGDLSFRAGDRIELVKRTESDQDWWTGRLDGREGQFPANYTQGA